MALLWLEGFEGFNASGSALHTDLGRKYPGSTFNNAKVETGRFVQGANAISGGSSGGVLQLFTPDFASAGTQYVMGAALKWREWPSGSGHPFLALFDGSTRQCGVWAKPNGILAFKRGSTELEEATTQLTIGQWYFIEMKVTIGNSGSYEVKVDGITVMSDTGVDTQESATAQATKAALEFDNITTFGKQQIMDDVYILDQSGTKNNDFLGDCLVEDNFPDGDGDLTEWTPESGPTHYVKINDPEPDDDSHYVESATLGDQELVDVNNLASINNVFGVQINVVAKQTAGEDLKILIKSGTTTSADAGQAVDSSYEELVRVEEDDPDTGAAWTASGVNSAQFGVEVA